MKYISAGFPPSLIKQLARIRKALGMSQSEVIRQGTQEKADALEKQIKKTKS